jgi:hypothetical protein
MEQAKMNGLLNRARAVRLQFVVALLLTLACCGCGDGGAKQKLLDDAQRSVETSLEAWKRGEKPASLLDGPHGIEFFDEDWNRSMSLVEYTVHATYLETDGTPRCAVDLVLKSGDQPPEQLRVTYEMVTKEQRLIIGRDPMS